MLDVVLIAVALGFFALSIGYTVACDRLMIFDYSPRGCKREARQSRTRARTIERPASPPTQREAGTQPMR
jgi:hypothetical protein